MFGLACTAVLSGCATPKEAVLPGSKYIVTAKRTAFYKYGPAQAFGADFQLNKDQRVTILERSFGYSHVTTADNVTGYVASEDLKPAPPDPIVRPTPSPALPQGSGGLFSGKVQRSNVEPTLGAPLFDTSDLPSPPSDKPDGRPGSPFRFRY
jgi:hypothetical protein